MTASAHYNLSQVQMNHYDFLALKSIFKWILLSSGHRTGKGQFSFQSQRKAMPKNVQFYHTIALISHASKVILKILQARLQQHVNQELPNVQAGFRKGRGTSKLPTSAGSSKKQESEKHLLLLNRLHQSF